MTGMITTDEIQHLADLSRITLTEQEADTLKGEVADIVDYVSTVQELSVEDSTPACGVVCNVFRKDEITNEPGVYTEKMLKAAPAVKNGYLEVKQILQNDDK